MSQGGLLDLLNEEIGEESVHYEIADYRGAHLEFAFTHTANYGENYFSFVNGQFTTDGGTAAAWSNRSSTGRRSSRRRGRAFSGRPSHLDAVESAGGHG
jgi:DNA gyrase/topoisomerase IV subunit B